MGYHGRVRIAVALLIGIGCWPRAAGACGSGAGRFLATAPAEGLHPVARNGRVYLGVIGYWERDVTVDLSAGGAVLEVPARRLARGGSVFEVEVPVPAETPFRLFARTEVDEAVYDFVSGRSGPDRDPPEAATGLSIQQELVASALCFGGEGWFIYVGADPVAGAGAYVLMRLSVDEAPRAETAWLELGQERVRFSDFARPHEEGQMRCYSIRTLDLAGNASDSRPICVLLGEGEVPAPPDLVLPLETEEPTCGCNATHGSEPRLSILLLVLLVLVRARAGR